MAESQDLVLNQEKTLVYRCCKNIVKFWAYVFFRPEVEGAQNIPLSGPVLIAPIHRSNVDFAFTLFLSKRKVFFMAKIGIFKPPIFAALLERLGAFPVRRDGTDRESLRLAEEVLHRGEALVMYPEGTRKVGLEVETLQDGAMFVAARTRATVIPVGVAGSDRAMGVGARFPRPTRIKIVVGRPISPPEGEGRVSRSEIAKKSEELRRELEDVYKRSLAKLD